MNAPLAAAPTIPHQAETFSAGLVLDCGVALLPLRVAYRTYGTLSAARDNAVLVCHALTGDQYVAEDHPLTAKPGWWDALVGPGLVIDTEKFFVVCVNVLGGCMGSTGPTDVNAATGRPWGLEFPAVTIRDMVRAQALLIERLGIEKLFAVIGGSMGGMQVLEWAATYPDRVVAAVPIATAAYHSAQNIAFNEVGRQAIFSDPDFHAGQYAAHGVVPARGLAVARMGAHITYLSAEALTRKFGRRRQEGAAEEMFQVESYLRHQGSSFVQRFDANSYVSITRAMDAFDLSAQHGGVLGQAFLGTRVKFCVVSFTSDWLFPTVHSREILRALNAAAANVSFVEIASDKGHDAFLLDEPAFHATLTGFLGGAWARR